MMEIRPGLVLESKTHGGKLTVMSYVLSIGGYVVYRCLNHDLKTTKYYGGAVLKDGYIPVDFNKTVALLYETSKR